DILGFKDIKCSNPQIIYPESSLAGAEVIARTIRGNICGFSKKIGKGTLMHLGTWIGFDTEGHKPVYEEILKRSGTKIRNASSGNDNITVRERFTGDNRAVLFIGNYYNEEQKSNVAYSHPRTGEILTIPYDGSDALWPPLYAILTPVCLDIVEGIEILHCTSDILNITEKEDHFEMTLYGNRDLVGEIVFEGENAEKIQSVSLNGKTCQWCRKDWRVVVRYSHRHKEEMILSVKIW
ncbi:MAG: hypothetical protein Q8867_09260, partial [Bacteroidota bacterium]|nr:hypothetical protein [Bacteroidota bacterium]